VGALAVEAPLVLLCFAAFTASVQNVLVRGATASADLAAGRAAADAAPIGSANAAIMLDSAPTNSKPGMFARLTPEP